MMTPISITATTLFLILMHEQAHPRIQTRDCCVPSSKNWNWNGPNGSNWKSNYPNFPRRVEEEGSTTTRKVKDKVKEVSSRGQPNIIMIEILSSNLGVMMMMMMMMTITITITLT